MVSSINSRNSAPLEVQLNGYGAYHLLKKREMQLKEYQLEIAKIQSEKFHFDPSRTFGGGNNIRSEATIEIKKAKAKAEWEDQQKELIDFIAPQIEKLKAEISLLKSHLEEQQAKLPEARSEIDEAIAAYREKVYALFAEYNTLHATIKKHQSLYKDCGHTLADYHTHFMKDLTNIPNPYITQFNTLQIGRFNQ